ncbi:ribonucleoside-diphosphate reductase, adenosylcobalamin-dependent [Microgenomates group bacterium RBG_16_45_19]|nr:MAG: ribonucleoside-diphosphate reductase, adenosylcobalamin-dependent [Microgenomates group bacterium RBG_16_45_19]
MKKGRKTKRLPTWQVVKLEGTLQTYDERKVIDAIFLAAQEAGGTDEARAQALGHQVTTYLIQQFGRQKQISTRDIGDAVERVLIENRQVQTAKVYILNRDKKREEYEAKIRLGVKDDLGLSLNSLVVMKHKYLLKRRGELETPKEALTRVARCLAQAESTPKRQQQWGEAFLTVMLNRQMLPAGRTLANAGTINNQLANCFVMPFPDDIEGIFEVVKESSILKKNGGAVGFSFSKVRPKGDVVHTTSGGAAGPVALMGILDHASHIFLQAGGRRSGNMVTLAVDHPDVFEFISCKESGTNLPNINYSLEVSEAFMQAWETDGDWRLVNPRNGQVVQTVSARSVLEQAARLAWRRGDPGVIFIDEINKYNPTPKVGRLNTVNLCGEQPLLDYEACNLGSINLGVHLKALKGKQSTIGDYTIDWPLLEKSTRVGIRLLDNVVTVCGYPLPQIEATVKANRKIGLGVMGWADMLIRLGIPYSSVEARRLALKVMRFIQQAAWSESEKLGKEKGSFPNFKGSLWEKRGYKQFRNATTTTIAPTGSLAMVAGASGGIEPLFALAFYRKAMGSYELPEVNQDLVMALKRHNGTYTPDLLMQIARTGSIQTIERVPEKIKRVFETAMDISAEDHVLMQAAFQKFTDNAVSKTINLPAQASVEAVIEGFNLAWKSKCKGITIYRNKSREVQVLNVGQAEPVKEDPGSQLSGQCPNCGGKLMMVEGCATCQNCDYSACSL